VNKRGSYTTVISSSRVCTGVSCNEARENFQNKLDRLKFNPNYFRQHYTCFK